LIISATAAPAGTSSPSTHDKAALNFSKQRLAEHDLRYEIATEFVDVVRGLWDSWDDDAVIADKTTGVYLDKSKIGPSTQGPVLFGERPAQHRAVAARPSGRHQAGGSVPGQELRPARPTWCSPWSTATRPQPRAAYDSLKQRVVKHGRAPDELPILPGVMPIIGETDEQAKEQLAACKAG
jgi:alkanesulfonate monooxygenase SsuD/methylene tetrahydromethanopterin reductase-like flavin-dependent oxidoreductase (luciferase family)